MSAREWLVTVGVPGTEEQIYFITPEQPWFYDTKDGNLEILIGGQTVGLFPAWSYVYAEPQLADDVADEPVIEDDVDDSPIIDPEPLDAAALYQLPVGTRVLDCDGDVWTRTDHTRLGWESYSGELTSATLAKTYGPIVEF